MEKSFHAALKLYGAFCSILYPVLDFMSVIVIVLLQRYSRSRAVGISVYIVFLKGFVGITLLNKYSI